jgi:hypothetical protein
MHQGQFYAKSLKVQSVMSDVIKIVNFIWTKSLQHRQLWQLSHDMDIGFEDIIQSIDGWVWQNVKVRLRSERWNTNFHATKKKPLAEFKDNE